MQVDAHRARDTSRGIETMSIRVTLEYRERFRQVEPQVNQEVRVSRRAAWSDSGTQVEEIARNKGLRGLP